MPRLSMKPLTPTPLAKRPTFGDGTPGWIKALIRRQWKFIKEDLDTFANVEGTSLHRIGLLWRGEHVRARTVETLLDAARLGEREIMQGRALHRTPPPGAVWLLAIGFDESLVCPVYVVAGANDVR